MTNELKKDVEKVKEIMYEQKGNIIKEIRNVKIKWNSGAEKYNN